jgi:hypothetical protein
MVPYFVFDPTNRRVTRFAATINAGDGSRQKACQQFKLW